MSKSVETDAELLMHGKHSNMACCLSNYGMQLSCIIKITVLIINIIWSTSFAIFSQYIQKQNASWQSNIAFVIQNLSAKGEHKIFVQLEHKIFSPVISMTFTVKEKIYPQRSGE